MKILFTQATAGIGYGYHTGETLDTSDKTAMDFVDRGYARIITNDPSNLPEDMPGRELLLKADLKTIEEVKKITDLTQIEGIGDVIAGKIIEYLKK